MIIMYTKIILETSEIVPSNTCLLITNAQSKIAIHYHPLKLWKDKKDFLRPFYWSVMGQIPQTENSFSPFSKKKKIHKNHSGKIEIEGNNF